MTQDQVAGIIRIVLTAIFGIIGTLGYMKGYDAAPLIALLTTTLVGWWSAHSNSIASMISKVAKSDDVSKVVTTHGIAAADPSPKVVSK